MSTATHQLWRWKNGLITAALATIVVALVWLGWALRKPQKPALPNARSQPAAYTIQWVDAPPHAGAAASPAPSAGPLPRGSRTPVPVVVEPGTSAWEQHIAAVLNDAEHPDSVKALTLLAMLPLLPEELLQSTTQAAVDRLRDEDYSAGALPLLLNAHTHGMPASVLFADLLDRPDSLTLPALLAIARTPDHPFASPALENLELLLGRDFGDDWAGWTEEVQRRLAAPQNRQ